MRTIDERTTYVYALSRRTGRVRRVSDEEVGSEGGHPSATAGLDWQPRPATP